MLVISYGASFAPAIRDIGAAEDLERTYCCACKEAPWPP